LVEAHIHDLKQYFNSPTYKSSKVLEANEFFSDFRLKLWILNRVTLLEPPFMLIGVGEETKKIIIIFFQKK